MLATAMKILVLGGTVFLGRHIVDEAIARGHDVTTFTRGRHNPELFPSVDKLRGDRDGGLHVLSGRRWDVAIDTSGHVPRLVRESSEFLSIAVNHYTLVSTLAVYAGFPRTPGLNETAALAVPADPGNEAVNVQTMGPLKALCEAAAEAAMPGRTLIVRGGLLVGPHDPTDRFTYWPRRVARGGEVLAPGSPAQPVQLIDARDLARWILDSAEARRVGAYNATGPATPLTLGAFLDLCRQETGGDARFSWVDDRFLLSGGVKPMMDLPLWAAGARGAATVDCRRAIAGGLTFRPPADTVRDTLAWDMTRGSTFSRRAGLAPEREHELLQAWHDHRQQQVPAS
jgi:2'-hydroxyisoflavone reductase